MKKVVKGSWDTAIQGGKPRYTVWIGFVNYQGTVQDKTPIAKFYHPNRAEEYAEWCNHTDAADPSIVYGVDYDK